VSQTPRCPHCGSPLRADPPGCMSTGDPGLDPLYREVRRIREIAESREAADGRRRIAELTREVAELRATVARLRGSAIVSVPADPAR
jgi:hypothetical protein